MRCFVCYLVREVLAGRVDFEQLRPPLVVAAVGTPMIKEGRAHEKAALIE